MYEQFHTHRLEQAKLEWPSFLAGTQRRPGPRQRRLDRRLDVLSSGFLESDRQSYEAFCVREGEKTKGARVGVRRYWRGKRNSTNDYSKTSEALLRPSR